ncbi:hypothetical protein CSC70_01595 [Pseudoxanthomonas kalamensis DSM 18571]|uniref:hypothetical protein n=1 Tax=Pseudoxanthomonas kalamensis TaxID=289483 RepID=UPI001391DBCF|nr:hypothetical protein [Pseudoxanthomonas kalamensis]KAF1712249.1 hypothetical protein CSC70_01595 [Pseudoxanthomonas kalamensis DSM 18571]
MARKMTRLDRAELRKWVIDDLTQSGLSTADPGVHQALLESPEMDRVWQLLKGSTLEYPNLGPAASLVITLGGLLRGPHRAELMSRKARRKKIARIDQLCADLAEEVRGLRDSDFGLPQPIDLAFDDAMGAIFESWESDVLAPVWTDAVLAMTNVLERRAGTRETWAKLVVPDANGARDFSRENLRRSLVSDESRTSEQAIATVMNLHKEETDNWLRRSIKDGFEPLLWALQDGVRAMADEPHLFHKPEDVDEQWAFVIRGVHGHLCRIFSTNMPEETAIVVRAIQDHAKDAACESSSLTASRVCEIVSSGMRCGKHEATRKAIG